MKAWALALVILVGCSQPVAPSPSERFNIEQETLERLNEDLDWLRGLKANAEAPDASQLARDLWDQYKTDFEQIPKIREAQIERVRASRRALLPSP